MGWNDPRANFVGQDDTPSSRPTPPTLLMRVAELNEIISSIEDVLNGTNSEKHTPMVQTIAVPDKAEEATTLISDGLDKAHARLSELRLRLLEHVRRLR